MIAWRHKLQEFVFENRDTSPLEDKAVESDEVFINSGEKGQKHLDFKHDPPRKRGNKARGIGTYAKDRPPVQGFFGRETKQIRLNVLLGARIDQIQPKVEDQTSQDAHIYTDESNAYNRVGQERGA